MPKLDTLWKDIEEKEAFEGFNDIEPGLYELVITSCEADESKQYFKVSWDVATGPYAGTYAKSQYPPTEFISWKDSVLGLLKHRLHVLADWNNNFKSTVAFETDQWGQFVGKHFGAVVRRQLYTSGPNSKRPGEDRQKMEIALWLNPEKYKAKDFDERLLADNDRRDAINPNVSKTEAFEEPAQVPQNFDDGEDDVYDEDIPF